MKNIQKQYQDLLEGKMSKANFMRNVRMQFPQHISSVNSFDDSVKILKGKRILSENISELSPQTRYNAGMKAGEKVFQSDNPSDSGRRKAISQGNKFLTQIDPKTKNAVESFAKSLNMKVEIRKKAIGHKYEPKIEIFMGHDLNNPNIIADIYKDKDEIKGNFPDEAAERKFERLVKQIQKDELDVELKKDKEEPEPQVGRGAGLMKQLGINLENSLNEAKKPIGVYGHNPNAEAEPSRGIDHLNYYQVYKGIQYELAKMPEITDENYIKARKKVVDTILKDPDAYKELQIANYKDIKKRDENLKMKEYKKVGNVDKANEMKVVKKDAPASANHVTKDSKKKEKISQMTQAPKGKLEAFPTPGKEKVMALKEHLLEDLTSANDRYEEIGKGSRVKKKELTNYDEAGVGNVEEFDTSTATVKWDNGEVEHVQRNVLTKKDIPQDPKAAQTFNSLPNMGSVRGPDTGVDPKLTQMQEVEKESKMKRLKEKLIKAIDKIKKEGAIARTKRKGVNLVVGSDANKVTQTAKGMEDQLKEPVEIINTADGKTRDI